MKMKKLGLTYKDIVLYILTFLIVAIGDQITKIMVDHTLQLGSGYTIIDDFFTLDIRIMLVLLGGFLKEN